MILEPKNKNFKGPLQIRDRLKIFNIQAPYVYTKGFLMILLKVILNCLHSFLK